MAPPSAAKWRWISNVSSERSNTETSVLGAGVVIIGNLGGQGALEVQGRVQGNLRLDGPLTIGRGGTVIGNITAHSVSIAGSVHGDIEARDGIEVQGPGSVEGNLSAPRIGIELGAEVRGLVQTGGAPAQKAPGQKAPAAKAASPKSQSVESSGAEPLLDEPVLRPAEGSSPAADFDDVEADEDLTEEARDPAEAEREEADPGALRARRRRRRRKRRSDSADPTSPASDEGWLESAPAQPAPAPAHPEVPAGPPRPPTFQKGAHAQRRRS